MRAWIALNCVVCFRLLSSIFWKGESAFTMGTDGYFNEERVGGPRLCTFRAKRLVYLAT